MHSLRALSASGLVMPLVFSLHIAILLLGFSAIAGLAFKQLLTYSCRALPSSFLSPASAWQVAILVCCVFALGPLLSSAAYALAQAYMPTRVRAKCFFIRSTATVFDVG